MIIEQSSLFHTITQQAKGWPVAKKQCPKLAHRGLYIVMYIVNRHL